MAAVHFPRIKAGGLGRGWAFLKCPISLALNIISYHYIKKLIPSYTFGPNYFAQKQMPTPFRKASLFFTLESCSVLRLREGKHSKVGHCRCTKAVLKIKAL